MAKVRGPLFSEKASGKLGKAIMFRCGHFVLKSPRIKNEKKEDASPAQILRRTKFTRGAFLWGNILTKEQREAWGIFVKTVIKAYGKYDVETPMITVRITMGEKKTWEECIPSMLWNAYQAWMSCYLSFDENGWLDYPNPPEYP